MTCLFESKKWAVDNGQGLSFLGKFPSLVLGSEAKTVKNLCKYKKDNRDERRLTMSKVWRLMSGN